MFTRILFLTLLLCFAGPTVSAGVIVFSAAGMEFQKQTVSSIELVGQPEHPTYQQAEPESDSACGAVSIVPATSIVALFSSQTGLLAAPAKTGLVGVFNASLPRPPCLDGLLKPA